jgi:hypothetical protein
MHIRNRIATQQAAIAYHPARAPAVAELVPRQAHDEQLREFFQV